MSAIRLAAAVLGAAVSASRHPAVRAGVWAVAANPKARQAVVTATRQVAFGAGVVARHIVGKRPQ